MTRKITPKFHRVLVRPVTRDKTRGGILIPDSAAEKDQPILGEVIAVGDGVRPPHYRLIPMQVEAGNKIIFRKHAGRHVKLDVGAVDGTGKPRGVEDLRFIAEEDIDAVYEGEVEVAS